jgi:hypothetical protein
MICGVLLVVCGVTVMDDGLPRWVVIGCGVLALLPWLGPAAILRRAERNPDVLIWDPARRADRAGRVAIVTTASQR